MGEPWAYEFAVVAPVLAPHTFAARMQNPPLPYPSWSAVLACCTLSMLLVGDARAQLAPDVRLADSTDLPEAIVIANRAPAPRQSVGHSLDILTAAELARLPVATVAEALQYVPGLDLRQRGPRGVQADLSIRGGTFDQVLVLVDGVRLTDPQTGHHTMNIPVPLASVERIEVLKGPGARLYGQNAFAGAINVVTKRAATDAVEVAGELGDWGSVGFGAAASLRSGDASHVVSYARDRSEGYRYNTAFDVETAFYQTRLLTARAGEFALLGGLTDRAFGANGFYALPKFTEQAEEIYTSLLAVSHRLPMGGDAEVSTRLSWRRNEDEYVLLRRNPSVYRNLHVSHVFGLDSYYGRGTALGRAGVGVDLQRLQLSSNLLGERERYSVNVLLEHAFRFANGRLEATPGLTLNYLTDGELTPLPGLDVVLQASEQVKVYANVGTTFRVPTYTDLYYRDPDNEGNPNLRPERAIAYELGAELERGPLHVRASVWQRDGTDLIDYVLASGTDSVWRATNINDTRFRGLETVATVRRLASWLPLASLSYSYIQGDTTLTDREDFAQSRYALDQLRHQALARVTFAVGPFTATPALRYGDRVELDGYVGPTPDYTLLDLRVAYTRARLMLYAEATNLTDETYTQANGVVLPGRWARGGVRWRW